MSCDQFSQQICFMHAIGVFFFSIPQRFGAVCVRACMCVCVWTKEEREFTLFLSHLISDLCYISLSKVV